MKRSITLITGAFLLLPLVLPAVPLRISIIQLIANPERYHGREIMVSGFVHFGMEHSAIYLGREDARYMLTKNGLWLTLPGRISSKQYNNRYVSLVGTFNMKSHGHLGMWAGTIYRVRRIWYCQIF